MEEIQTPAGGTPTELHYVYSGNSDTPAFTLTKAGATQEQTIELPGGATLSRTSIAQTWSYPDLSGHNIVTADQTGARQGNVALYDPFGDPINPTTGAIGATNADQAGPQNSATPNTSSGFDGKYGKQFLTLDGIDTIEMGARQYVPLLGRFLSIDPQAGGNANDYNFPNDPVNHSDLTGERSITPFGCGSACVPTANSSKTNSVKPSW